MNVLWIMTDQHQAGCLGCMGNRVIQTPNLDRLAGGGVLFENAFCQSPVCMASRGALLTGRYPGAIGIRGMGILPPAETTFAEWLRRQGFSTGAFGKLHFTPEQYTKRVLKSETPVLDWRCFARDACLPELADDPFKHNYGFQEHVGCDDACQGNFRAWLKQTAPELLDRQIQRFPDAPADLFVSPYPSAYHQSSFIAGQTAAFIRNKAGSGQPWHAFCSFVAPHHPFEAPEDQIQRYALADMPLPDPELGVSISEAPAAPAQGLGEMHRYAPAVQRRIIQHYYAAISLVDDCVGRLLETLEECGQRHQTLIVFVADHGEHLGNHGLLRKTSFHYDEILRVPMILSGPGCPAGRRVRGLVELVDVYPTLLGLLGLPKNPGVQGIDWSGALGASPDAIGREDICSDMFDMDPMTHAKASGPYTACRTIRTAKWKLNVYPAGAFASSQLFDLENDPREARNLFHEQGCRQVREEMLWRLLRRLHADADPLPLRLTQW